MTDIKEENIIPQGFSDREKCMSDIMLARGMFGNINTTRAQYEAMEKALRLMYLYCPEDIKERVLLTVEEARLRKQYFYDIWIYKGVGENNYSLDWMGEERTNE